MSTLFATMWLIFIIIILATVIARRVGLGGKGVNNIAICSLRCDVGKIIIDDKMLKEKYYLTQSGWGAVKKYPIVAINIVSLLKFLESIASSIFLYRHERYDRIFRGGRGSEESKSLSAEG